MAKQSCRVLGLGCRGWNDGNLIEFPSEPLIIISLSIYIYISLLWQFLPYTRSTYLPSKDWRIDGPYGKEPQSTALRIQAALESGKLSANLGLV